MERRLAVIDLGSNSFRLVVFTHTPEWWKRTDEIYEPVRVGEGQEVGLGHDVAHCRAGGRAGGRTFSPGRE